MHKLAQLRLARADSAPGPSSMGFIMLLSYFSAHKSQFDMAFFLSSMLMNFFSPCENKVQLVLSILPEEQNWRNLTEPL